MAEPSTSIRTLNAEDIASWPDGDWILISRRS